MTNVIENRSSFTPNHRKLLLKNFSYEAYKEKMERAIA